MKTLCIILSVCVLLACAEKKMDTSNNTAESIKESTLTYPTTKKVEVVDTYFGKDVADPYRWLEDDRSPETAEWVKAQNTVTYNYLDKIPYRNALKQRLQTLWNYEKVGSPFKEGDYTYFYKNDGLQNHYVVWRQKNDADAEVFLDPNTFSKDGTTSLASLSFSKDGSLAAYSVSEAGSDWRKIFVIDAETKQILEAPLENVKFSGMSWKGNEGFFYSRYDKPEGSELSAITDQHKLYFHKLGQTQAEDSLIFGGKNGQNRRFVSGHVTDDDRYLVVSGAHSTSGNDLYIKDLSRENSPFVTVLDDFKSDAQVIENVGTKLYVITNRDAPNGKIVTVDASDPIPENWQEFIPETENVLRASTGGGYFFAKYMVDALSKMYQYDYQGKKVREITLPGLGTASGIGGKQEDALLYYTFHNYKTPVTIYAYDVGNGESSVYRKSGVQFNSDDYESKQVFYRSKDGTKVPMMVTHKKGIELNGKNPTILYGYGGFNVSLTPSFGNSTAAWLEQGGVFAVPNLRGGGEYGKKWHLAGTKLSKQNVFDDFIAAAEYLIDKQYTSSEFLAMSGGSNGGLLVGAVMTQRPELMRVALPSVGVLDMLRYHTFTSGASWAYDYGTSEESREMFEYLLGYSPLHNLNTGTNYPATMVTTADHDDRVVPAHSFKFAAELQNSQAGPAPVLIRVETDAGHGSGKPVSKVIDEYADVYSFTLYNMGVTSLNN